MLPAGALADDTQRRRFHREALALSRLNHPGGRTVHEFDREAGADYIVMELVKGDTLAQRLKSGLLPVPEVTALGMQIAEALGAAHDRGVLHRDLKPTNIVLTDKGRVKVLDFGLAKLVQAGRRQQRHHAAHGRRRSRGHTRLHGAPSSCWARMVDAASDLFSLGVVLYEMATGKMPWRQTLATALVNEIVHSAARSTHDPASRASRSHRLDHHARRWRRSAPRATGRPMR